MPDVYEGNEPYIFVSYAHADRDAALPIIRALADEGYRVWYDDAVQIGSRYSDYIARHVLGCACFVALLSEASKASEWCEQEAHYALDLHKPVLPVYLEEVELEPGLRMRLGTRQAMYWYAYDSDAVFLANLFVVSMLDRCLTDEGGYRRGVKPRAVESKAHDAVGFAVEDSVVASTGVKAERPGASVRVVPKRRLADYSWDELKELSRAIAAAGSDANGLSIAREYHLVNDRSEILCNTKKVEFANGVEAHVQILGFLHDELVSGGRAGISFGFSDVPMTHEMNNGLDNNIGGWKLSGMRRWLNSSFLSFLPDDLRNNVVEVKKYTNNTGGLSYGYDVSCTVTSTSDKLWLLSMTEIFGRLSCQKDVPGSYIDAYDAEGNQYKLYEDSKISTTNYAFCKKVGAHSIWWLRSPHASCGVDFHFIDENGFWSDQWSYAKEALGVSPGFCL